MRHLVTFTWYWRNLFRLWVNLTTLRDSLFCIVVSIFSSNILVKVNRKTNGVYANEHEKEKLVFSAFCFFQRFLIFFFFRRIAWSLFSAKITSPFHRRSYRDMTASKGPMVDPARRVQVVSGEDCSLHIEWDSTDTNRKRKRRAQIARRMSTRMKWWLFIMRQRRTKLSVRSRTVFFDILPERKNKFKFKFVSKRDGSIVCQRNSERNPSDPEPATFWDNDSRKLEKIRVIPSPWLSEIMTRAKSDYFECFRTYSFLITASGAKPSNYGRSP